jgi:hypothetical protein
MLPPSGTQAREVLEDQASQIGLASLARGEGDIPGALYSIYVAFRLRFIEERGLMDAAPGAGDQWPASSRRRARARAPRAAAVGVNDRPSIRLRSLHREVVPLISGREAACTRESRPPEADEVESLTLDR